MQNILGLGPHRKKFVYFDEFIPKNLNWEKLHSDVCYGISQSIWNKKFVSSGVHKNWEEHEITPYMRMAEQNLNSYEYDYYKNLKSVDEKIKYITALKYISHPFWLIYIRDNKRIESTGLINKHKSEDCNWTDNSKHFTSLIELTTKLPFKSIGRILIFLTESNNSTVPHFDGRYQNDRPNDDFIWFTTKSSTKNIFIMDATTLEKHYPEEEKKFIWFNEMDYHGTDAVDHFSFSIRIDGIFDKEIKKSLLC